MIVNVLFYVFGAILVLAALGVITARNPVHCALFLVAAFLNSAVIWLLLQAEFLALTLVVVYVGAVMVLFLFVVMMLDINLERLRQGFWGNLWLGGPIAVLMVIEMVAVLSARSFGLDAMPEPAAPAAGYSNTKALGMAIYTDYVYPFELASVILLVALIAAVVLNLRQRRDNKQLNPGEQIAIQRKDRVRIVSMPSEKE